jgi:hypothetical protein
VRSRCLGAVWGSPETQAAGPAPVGQPGQFEADRTVMSGEGSELLPIDLSPLEDTGPQLYHLGRTVRTRLSIWAHRRACPSPRLFRRLQIGSAVIWGECGSPMLPFHRNRLRLGRPKGHLPLRMNAYP